MSLLGNFPHHRLASSHLNVDDFLALSYEGPDLPNLYFRLMNGCFVGYNPDLAHLPVIHEDVAKLVVF